MMITTKEEAKKVLNLCITKLTSIDNADDMLNDGCDENDEQQNKSYGEISKEVNSIHEKLAFMDFEFISSDECDRIWKEAWNGSQDKHLPENKYNHAIEYANRLIEYINKL